MAAVTIHSDLVMLIIIYFHQLPPDINFQTWSLQESLTFQV